VPDVLEITEDLEAGADSDAAPEQGTDGLPTEA
jgi:hypothetical protein